MVTMLDIAKHLHSLGKDFMGYEKMKLYGCLRIAVCINEYIYPPPPLATILMEGSAPNQGIIVMQVIN